MDWLIKRMSCNWCTSCNTVLANEQVVECNCERCDSEVIKKNLNQWFLRYLTIQMNC